LSYRQEWLIARVSFDNSNENSVLFDGPHLTLEHRNNNKNLTAHQ